MSGTNGNGRKPGPKPKIGPEEEQRIYDILKTGASLNDAAAIIGVGRATINDYKRANEEFRKGVDRTICEGKARLIRKVGKASAWQAAAWMLERKWGREFGRKEIVRQEITGKNGRPIEISDAGLKNLSIEELRKLRELRLKLEIPTPN